MRALIAPILGVLIATQATLPAEALAAEPKNAREKAQAQAAARKLGEDGLILFGEKKYAEAYEVFRSADEMFHANTLVLFMAHCRRETGRLLEARAIYKQVVDEPVPKGAMDQFKKAQATAAEELTKLAARIPTLRLSLSGAGVDKANVRINGAPTPAEELTGGKEIDPGEHKIRVEAPGAVPEERVVTVNEGGETTVEIELAAAKVAQPVKQKGSILPGVIVLGAGAAAAGVGAVTGFMAKSQIDDIKSRCTPDGHCLVSDQANADSAQTLKTVATIGFMAGGVLLAGGAVLVIVRPFGKKEAESTGSNAFVTVGVGSIGVGGSF